MKIKSIEQVDMRSRDDVILKTHKEKTALIEMIEMINGTAAYRDEAQQYIHGRQKTPL